jgi:hypothetical protein
MNLKPGARTMRMHTPLNLTVAATVTMALLASMTSCVTNADGTYAKDEKGNYIIDQKAKAALVGAAVGCAVGSATNAGCAQGAVVGAAAGFLIGWYFESRKVASGQDVNKQYAANKKSTPPPKEVVPVSFASQVLPSKADASGEREVKVTSSTDMIGYGDKVPDVQQKYAIYDEKNNLVETKTEKLTVVDGAGRYQTSSKFKLPASSNGKQYTVKTALVSDNKTFKEDTYKVSLINGQHTVVLALAN